MQTTKIENVIMQYDNNSIEFPKLRTIKYSGNKVRLMPYIMRVIRKYVKPSGSIFDVFAGTHCVGYALKSLYRICANDIQQYSYTIGRAYIENGGYSVDRHQAEKELLSGISENQRTNEYDLFQTIYAGTYFSQEQCIEIDNIRKAIDAIPSPRRELYLTALMSAMCYASNTTGHFAEFLRRPSSNPKSVQELFFLRCENLTVLPNRYSNRAYNNDYQDYGLFVVANKGDLNKLYAELGFASLPEVR